MFIYRLEHNITQEGPYTHSHTSILKWTTKNHTYSENTPLPTEDKLNNSNGYLHTKIQSEHQKFGFKNIKQLLKWFDKEEIENLLKYGFNIVKIKVNEKHVHCTSKQLVYYEENQEREIITI